MITTVVTDIEGTTSDILFVQQVLFPYARERLAGFLRRREHEPEVASALSALRREIASPHAILADLIAELFTLMDEDRKSTALKAIQGMIWRDGYVQGDFQGHLYPDVAPCLTRWRRNGISLYVYSSGSVEAQQLLFGYSEAGDLRPLFDGYFDTRVGTKRNAASYRNIADRLQRPAEEILFLSDVCQELDAAREAGWRTCRLIRDQAEYSRLHPHVNHFDQIDLQELAS
ncbi:acireductone synthase [Acerihabitans sp. KWT182]|uniref:Enolase-phosphatase E1 n=1 Tax=Acerihabitans sp. KWT182 TaxID=3157919 RepID=A0AAU7Q8B1_9GAMM